MIDQCLETLSGEPNLVMERLRSHLRRPTVGSVHDFGVAIALVFHLHSMRYNLSKLHLPPCWHHSWIIPSQPFDTFNCLPLPLSAWKNNPRPTTRYTRPTNYHHGEVSR